MNSNSTAMIINNIEKICKLLTNEVKELHISYQRPSFSICSYKEKRAQFYEAVEINIYKEWHHELTTDKLSIINSCEIFSSNLTTTIS